MSVAWELEVEEWRPRLYALPEHATTRIVQPAVSRRWRAGVVVIAAVAILLVLLALPIRSLGGSTLAQAAPAQGQEYVVKSGDTLASIAQQADPTRAASLAGRMADEIGSTTVVPGEHLFIP